MPSPVEFLPLTSAPQLPEYDSSSLAATIERGSIQAAHRFAAVSIFATLAAWLMVYQGESDRWAGGIALASSDLGLCAALLAALLARRQGRRPSAENTGVFIANLVLLALSLQLMLFTRLEFLQAAIEKFFTNP